MRQKYPPINTVAQIALLVILGFALVFAITSLRSLAPGKLSPAQRASFVITTSYAPAPNESQAAETIIALKAIGEGTYLAITRTPETPIYLPTGIYDDQRVRISADLLFIDAQNAWGGFIDGYRFSLYAGSLQSDSYQGIVGLVINMPGGKSIEMFVSPSKHGALKVVTQRDNRFTLIATDGMIFYFDLPTRQFVASSTEIAPSGTPSPSVTPEPTLLPYPPPTESNPGVL
jgi:hypothetical protein